MKNKYALLAKFTQNTKNAYLTKASGVLGGAGKADIYATSSVY